MAWVWGSAPTVSTLIQRNQEAVKASARAVGRHRRKIEDKERFLQRDIRTHLKNGRQAYARELAKQLLRSQASALRLVRLESHLNGVADGLAALDGMRVATDSIQNCGVLMMHVNAELGGGILDEIVNTFAQQTQLTTDGLAAIEKGMDKATAADVTPEEERELMEKIRATYSTQLAASMPALPRAAAVAVARMPAVPSAPVAVPDQAEGPADPPMDDADIDRLEQRLRNLKRR
jgi:hypothetical protein